MELGPRRPFFLVVLRGRGANSRIVAYMRDFLGKGSDSVVLKACMCWILSGVWVWSGDVPRCRCARTLHNRNTTVVESPILHPATGSPQPKPQILIREPYKEQGQGPFRGDKVRGQPGEKLATRTRWIYKSLRNPITNIAKTRSIPVQHL